MTNKLKYFIGNWKMFGDHNSLNIIHKIDNFNRKFKKKGIRIRNRIIMCVPNTLISFFNQRLKPDSVLLGAQNCHHEKYGAFTGSVSASMIRKVGAKYIILGHSECRKEGDSNKLIKKKIESALRENLNIIFCFGETIKEKNEGKTYSIIQKQISDSLDKNCNFTKLIFAYEPVWSIGSGILPKNIELKKIFKYTKNLISKKYLKNKSPIILYGGSVNSKNIGNLSLISEIDGFLVGGASQSSKKFIDIIKNYYK